MILSTSLTVLACLCFAITSQSRTVQPDPCAVIGGKKWVTPKAVRECLHSFKLEDAVKQNILDVVNKTLAFHTSVNYQIQAPAPYSDDVHENVLADLERIRDQKYPSEFAMHIDLSRTLKRLNDGHCAWINSCYDSLYLSFLPLPLSLVTSVSGLQTVRISPEAFNVTKAEFPDNIEYWEQSLPPGLKLESASSQLLSGAEVVMINGQPPIVAVNENSKITGSFQSLGARQRAFFSAYGYNDTGSPTYIMGNFAQQSLPLNDEVNLTVRRINCTSLETIKAGPKAILFSDSASLRKNNCQPVNTTNGVDLYANTTTPLRQVPTPQRHFVNILLDNPSSDVFELPPSLQPPLPTITGSKGPGQFYVLGNNTGVLTIGSFVTNNLTSALGDLVNGLQKFKALGVTKLIVDVASNGGGSICMGTLLNRMILGPTEERIYLQTAAREGTLARHIVKEIISNDTDPKQLLLYNPAQWTNASDIPFPPRTNWLDPKVKVVINKREDAFSQRLGNECLSGIEFPPGSELPDVALFQPQDVVILSNTRLVPTTMSKIRKVKTVVVGGFSDVPQDVCGTVGGQSYDFSSIMDEVKTTGLEKQPDAPPDLIVNGIFGFVFRLAYSPDEGHEDDPEEWRPHTADLRMPLTLDNVNNPAKTWEDAAAMFWGGKY